MQPPWGSTAPRCYCGIYTVICIAHSYIGHGYHSTDYAMAPLEADLTSTTYMEDILQRTRAIKKMINQESSRSSNTLLFMPAVTCCREPWTRCGTFLALSSRHIIQFSRHRKEFHLRSKTAWMCIYERVTFDDRCAILQALRVKRHPRHHSSYIWVSSSPTFATCSRLSRTTGSWKRRLRRGVGIQMFGLWPSGLLAMENGSANLRPIN